MLTQIIWKQMGLPQQSGFKPMEPLGVYLDYSPELRDKSFCLGLQGPLILAIHAICFPSPLSGIFTGVGGKQIFGRMNSSLSTGDRIRLDPGGTGSKHTFGSPGSRDRHSLCGANSRDKLHPAPEEMPLAQLTGG